MAAMSIYKSPLAIFFLYITVRERERENMRGERKREGKGEGWERDVIYRESESGGHDEDSSYTMTNCMADYLWDN